MTTAAIRRWHAYIGLFTAPSVLFFALTGSAQLFNLHEAHGSYRPPAVLEKLSSVHKDQVFSFGDHHSTDEPPVGTGPAAGPAPRSDAGEDREQIAPATVLLKWFFLIVGLFLVVSTLFGIWMGLAQIRSKRLAWLLLVVGTLVPSGLLIFSPP